MSVLIHRRLRPLYDYLRDLGFVMEPYTALNTSREKWIQQFGAQTVDIQHKFGTKIHISEMTPGGDVGNYFSVYLHSNFSIMFDFFDRFFLCWEMDVHLSSVWARAINFDEAKDFMKYLYQCLECLSTDLTQSTVTLILCLTNVGIPKDVARMFGIYHFQNKRREIIRSLNVLPEEVIKNPEKF